MNHLRSDLRRSRARRNSLSLELAELNDHCKSLTTGVRARPVGLQRQCAAMRKSYEGIREVVTAMPEAFSEQLQALGHLLENKQGEVFAKIRARLEKVAEHGREAAQAMETRYSKLVEDQTAAMRKE